MLDPRSDKPGRTTRGRSSRRQCPPSSRKARGVMEDGVVQPSGVVTSHRSDVFSFFRLPNRRRGRSICSLPTQSRAELQTRRRRMGQDVRSPRGPRCIALVGPFQSGKTTLLEAILARTGAIRSRRQRRCRNFRRRRQPRGAPSQDGRRPHRRHHQFHGRQLHLHRLSRLDRVRA